MRLRHLSTLALVSNDGQSFRDCVPVRPRVRERTETQSYSKTRGESAAVDGAHGRTQPVRRTHNGDRVRRGAPIPAPASAAIAYSKKRPPTSKQEADLTAEERSVQQWRPVVSPLTLSEVVHEARGRRSDRLSRFGGASPPRTPHRCPEHARGRKSAGRWRGDQVSEPCTEPRWASHSVRTHA